MGTKQQESGHTQMKNQTGIYEIINTVNGKRYIGQASNFAERWKRHISALRLGKHKNRHLQSAWNKYGEAAFKFLPILTCAKTKEMLCFYEQQLLDKVKPEYNISPTAGTTLGIPCSGESREKNIKSHTGKALTLEHKAAISRGKTGRKLSPKHCAATSRGKTGIKHSPEHCAALSRAATGRKHSPEHCVAISRGLTGKNLGNSNALGHRFSPEQNAAKSVCMLGKKRGPYKTKRK